jgi:ATP-dependent helicase/nuclease subunit A
MGTKRLEYTELLTNIRMVPKEAVEALEDSFSYEYPYQSDADRKVKYSVSELKHMSMAQKYDEEMADAERPAFLQNEREPYIPAFAQAQKQREDAHECTETRADKDADARECTETRADKAAAECLEGSGISGVNRGALRGTAVHRVMECLDFAKICAIDCTDTAQAALFVREELERMQSADELPKEMAGLIIPAQIEGFVRSDVAQRMAEAAKNGMLFKEKPFVMKHQGVLVQGIIDVFWMEDDRLVLLDYKTDRVETAEELGVRYETQLDLYADALARIFSNEEKQVTVKERLIYSFALQKVIAV